jgi:signal transduction histidine kinase
MNTWIDNRSASVKLTANIALTMIALLLIGGVALIGLRAQMWQDRQDRVQAAVSIAEGYANVVDAQVRAGEMSREAGRALLLRTLQAIKFGPDAYFVVVTDGCRA